MTGGEPGIREGSPGMTPRREPGMTEGGPELTEGSPGMTEGG